MVNYASMLPHSLTSSEAPHLNVLKNVQIITLPE